MSGNLYLTVVYGQGTFECNIVRALIVHYNVLCCCNKTLKPEIDYSMCRLSTKLIITNVKLTVSKVVMGEELTKINWQNPNLKRHLHQKLCIICAR